MTSIRTATFARRAGGPHIAVSAKPSAQRQRCVARSSQTVPSAASYEVLSDALAVFKSAPEQMVRPTQVVVGQVHWSPNQRFRHPGLMQPAQPSTTVSNSTRDEPDVSGDQYVLTAEARGDLWSKGRI